MMFKNYLLPDVIKECFLQFVQVLPKVVPMKNSLGNIKISHSGVLPLEIDSVILGRTQTWVFRTPLRGCWCCSSGINTFRNSHTKALDLIWNDSALHGEFFVLTIELWHHVKLNLWIIWDSSIYFWLKYWKELYDLLSSLHSKINLNKINLLKIPKFEITFVYLSIRYLQAESWAHRESLGPVCDIVSCHRGKGCAVNLISVQISLQCKWADSSFFVLDYIQRVYLV